MKKNKFPTCPYCGRKLNFSKAWAIHSKIEYTCPNCSYVSEVEFSNNIRRNALITVVLSISLILIFSLVDRIRIWEIIISIIPFAVFYLTVPKNLRLNKTEQSDKRFFDDAIEDEKKKQKQRMLEQAFNKEKVQKKERHYISEEETSDKTIIMPEINEKNSNTKEINRILEDKTLFENTGEIDDMSFTALFDNICNEKE